MERQRKEQQQEAQPLQEMLTTMSKDRRIIKTTGIFLSFGCFSKKSYRDTRRERGKKGRPQEESQLFQLLQLMMAIERREGEEKVMMTKLNDREKTCRHNKHREIERRVPRIHQVCVYEAEETSISPSFPLLSQVLCSFIETSSSSSTSIPRCVAWIETEGEERRQDYLTFILLSVLIQRGSL